MDASLVVEPRLIAAAFAISPSAKKLLRLTGYKSIKEVLRTKPSELSRELNMSQDETVRLLEEIREAAGFSNENALSQIQTALDLYDAEKSRQTHIVTFCESLDNILGGGIRTGEVTELCGTPGCGKTQICIQLAVDTCIPESFGGIDGDVIYVDSEGSFDIERVIDMAKPLINHLHRNLVAQQKAAHPELRRQEEELQKISKVDDILKRIMYCRVYNYTEQIALVNSIPSLIQRNPKIKLLILDSVAFHFRHGFENMAKRTRVLNAHAQRLNMIAGDFQVAVVVTNQMTTKIRNIQSGSTGSESYLVPALGELWSHAITSRLLINVLDEVCQLKKRKRGNEEDATCTAERVYVRSATLVKSPARQHDSTEFIITQSGVRKKPR